MPVASVRDRTRALRLARALPLSPLETARGRAFRFVGLDEAGRYAHGTLTEILYSIMLPAVGKHEKATGKRGHVAMFTTSPMDDTHDFWPLHDDALAARRGNFEVTSPKAAGKQVEDVHPNSSGRTFCNRSRLRGTLHQKAYGACERRPSEPRWQTLPSRPIEDPPRRQSQARRTTPSSGRTLADERSSDKAAARSAGFLHRGRSEARLKSGLRLRPPLRTVWQRRDKRKADSRVAEGRFAEAS
jgi:hypothetical protein